MRPVPDAIGMRIEELLLNHSPWIGIDDPEYDKFTRRNRGFTETANRLWRVHVVQKTTPVPFFSPDIGHRVATICHLGNIAIKVGRTLKWDPDQEVFPGDDEANAFLSRPMRSPWKLT